jgi:hypothetical protein
MPKVHDIGNKRFIQYVSMPAKWGWKLYVKGWTQEIVEPFRTTDNALIVRLPFHKAFVFGKWTGTLDEEQALEKAIEGRVLTDEDFDEEKGWVPAPNQNSEESCQHCNSRPNHVGGECPLRDWEKLGWAWSEES